MAVTVDATATGGSNFNSGEATFTWNHTVAADATFLVVTISGQSTGSISGVTWNGDAMTLLDSSSGDEYVSIWYLLNPDTGTHAFIASKTNSNNYMGAASISLKGAGAIAQTLDSSGTSNPSLSKTNITSQAAGICITLLGYNDPGTLTYNGGHTEWANLTRGPGKTQRSTYYIFSGGADVTESWTDTHNRGYNIIGCEVYPGITEYTVTVTAKARVKVAGNNKTVTAKARVKVNQTKTVTAKARVKIPNNTATLTAKAMILLQFSQTIDAKANIFNTVDKTIQALARVFIPDNTESIEAQARILVVQSATLQAKARILVLQTQAVTAKARIFIPDNTATVTAQARIKQAGVTATISGMARVKVAGITNTLTAKARIWAARLGITVGRRDDYAMPGRRGSANIQFGTRFVRNG